MTALTLPYNDTFNRANGALGAEYQNLAVPFAWANLAASVIISNAAGTVVDFDDPTERDEEGSFDTVKTCPNPDGNDYSVVVVMKEVPDINPGGFSECTLRLGIIDYVNDVNDQVIVLLSLTEDGLAGSIQYWDETTSHPSVDLGIDLATPFTAGTIVELRFTGGIAAVYLDGVACSGTIDISGNDWTTPAFHVAASLETVLDLSETTVQPMSIDRLFVGTWTENPVVGPPDINGDDPGPGVGRTAMPLMTRTFQLASITGLKAWTHYIPVKFGTYTGRADSFDDNGYLRVEDLVSVTGLTAWVHYTPVFDVTALSAGNTHRWKTTDLGWLPVTNDAV